jgi:hypothetical protein
MINTTAAPLQLQLTGPGATSEATPREVQAQTKSSQLKDMRKKRKEGLDQTSGRKPLRTPRTPRDAEIQHVKDGLDKVLDRPHCSTPDSAPDGTITQDTCGTNTTETWTLQVQHQDPAICDARSEDQDQSTAGTELRSKLCKEALIPLHAATESGSEPTTLTPSTVSLGASSSARSPMVYNLAAADRETPVLNAEFTAQLLKANLGFYAEPLARLGVEDLSDVDFLSDKELWPLGMRLVHVRKLRALAAGEVLTGADSEEAPPQEDAQEEVLPCVHIPARATESAQAVDEDSALLRKKEADVSGAENVTQDSEETAEVEATAARSPRSLGYAKGALVKARQHQIVLGTLPVDPANPDDEA